MLSKRFVTAFVLPLVAVAGNSVSFAQELVAPAEDDGGIVGNLSWLGTEAVSTLDQLRKNIVGASERELANDQKINVLKAQAKCNAMVKTFEEERVAKETALEVVAECEAATKAIETVLAALGPEYIAAAIMVNVGGALDVNFGYKLSPLGGAEMGILISVENNFSPDVHFTSNYLGGLNINLIKDASPLKVGASISLIIAQKTFLNASNGSSLASQISGWYLMGGIEVPGTRSELTNRTIHSVHVGFKTTSPRFFMATYTKANGNQNDGTNLEAYLKSVLVRD